MRIIKGVTFFLLLIALQAGAKVQESVDYEIYVNQIIKVFTKEMEEEHNLICIGSGGSMPYNVRDIKVVFASYQKPTIEKARKLEVKATERLLQMINSHEKIRPFLSSYPFKANQAKVSISFWKKDNTMYSDGSLMRVTQIKNIIYYQANNEKSPIYTDLHEEPYEEALKIVKAAEHEKH